MSAFRVPGILFVPVGDEADLNAEGQKLRAGLLAQFGIEVVGDIVFKPDPENPGVFTCVYTIKLPPPSKFVIFDNLLE